MRVGRRRDADRTRRPKRPGRVLAVLLVCGVAACGMKEVPEEDWGAITLDARIRVTTVDGARHDLRGVRVYTDDLTGERAEDSTRVRIPLDSVEVVETGSSAAGPILAGIAVAAATIWIIQARGKSDQPPPPTAVPDVPGSCPFIYSFDGDGWHLDSETYAGAVMEPLKRTDLDNLDHLRPVDGLYRLRLANERPETQYTDALTLRVVDHPRGTSVYTDASGAPRLIRDGRAPVSATGLRGADVLASVAHADDDFWSGDPVLTIDADDPSSFRDGMTLAFERPEADAALLAVRSQNTTLAPFVLEHFLGLFGDDLTGWYRRVDRDPALQSRLRDWIAREGTLHVSVRVDGRWVRQDALLDVGPHLPKTQVARLDLSEVDGDEVEVRLEGPRGLWTVDHVALGVEAAAGPTVHDLEPLEALGPDGRDVRVELSASDERYFTALTGDEVELVFRAPPEPAADLERSVMARTAGFYHVYAEQSGPARLDIVDRILDEPRFVNRYMLSVFRGTPLEN